MKIFIALSVIALCRYGMASMSGETPSVTMNLETEEMGKFKFDAKLTQYFSRESGMGKIKVAAKVMSLGEDVSKGRAYFGNVPDCDTFMENSTDVMNVTELIQIVTENSTDVMPIEIDGNLFEIFKAKKFVGFLNGEKYCNDFEVEVNGMKMLRLKYQPCPDFNRGDIRKVIADKVDLDMDMVEVGEYGTDGDCAFADIYLNDDFNSVKKLQQAYRGFSEMNQLGLFSPTKTCMADVDNSFVVKYMKKLFLAFDNDEEREEPLKTCAGISTTMAKQYQYRLKKYDAVMKAYYKKYGKDLDVEFDNMDLEQPAISCNCSEYSSEAVRIWMQVKTIADYIGLPLENPDLNMKKETLKAMLEGAMPDMEKVRKLTEEIKELQEEQGRTFWDTQYGACMVAGWPDPFEKLYEIKKRMDAASPSKKEALANDILKELLMDSIKYSLDNIHLEREPSVELFRSKLQTIFGVTNSCSNENERKRVIEYLMKMTESLPSQLENMTAMIDNENVTRAINEIGSAVMADPTEAAKKIFLLMYAPIDVKEDDEMYQKAKTLAMALKDNAEEIAAKAKEWVRNEPDKENLMAMQVMLLRKADIEKGCDLSALVNRVKEVTAPIEDLMASTQEPRAQEPPCRAARRQGRRDRPRERYDDYDNDYRYW